MRRSSIATILVVSVLAWTAHAQAQYEQEQEGQAGAGFEAGGYVEGDQGGGTLEQPEAEPAAEMDVEGTGLPLPYAQRPLTLTQGTIRGDVAFSIAHIQFTFEDPITGMRTTTSDTATALVLGGAYGIIDDFEVGATVLPLQLSPDAEYGDPSIYGVFRFVSGMVDVGASLTLRFPVQGDFVLAPGLPVLLHIGDNMRLDTGVFLPVQFADPDTIASLSIPVRFAVNVIPEVFLGARTGFTLPDFDGDLASFALGFFGGYTLAGGDGGPLADFTVDFGFPSFLIPGSEGDVVFTNLWTLTFGASFYIDT